MDSVSSVTLVLDSSIGCLTSTEANLIFQNDKQISIETSTTLAALPSTGLSDNEQTESPTALTGSSNMIRGAGGGDVIISKTFKDDLNVIQSTLLEKERNEAKGEQSLLQTSLLAQKASLYTTTVGSYIAWRTDVNLGPPSSDIPVPHEDTAINNYYNALQYTLYETGYPETEDRSNTPRTNMHKDRVTIAVLSSPVECLGILLEGGRQCSGDMLLILSTSWLTKQKSAQKNGAYSLLVHKAITFESAGRSFIDVFDPPRRVTYFINFFTRGCTYGARNDGAELEFDLDCPMSSSLTLSRIVDDKLWTRIMMAESGLVFPETLAFTFCSTLHYDTESSEIIIVSLDTKTGVENLLLEEIKKFVSSPMMQKHEKIVVKPSGVMWHGSLGISYHARSDVVSIWKSALQLLQELEEENVLIIEAFYETVCPRNSVGFKWGANETHAAHVRATVVRGRENVPHMTQIYCGIGRKRDPLNGDNSVPQSLETTLMAFGITEKSVCDSISEEIKSASESLLQCIMSYEDSMSSNERGNIGAQTDLIGIDYVLAEIGSKVVPVGIEVNSHDCTRTSSIYEAMNPKISGEAFRLVIQNMINRSQQFIMRGKKVLVIGACGYSKGYIWRVAKEYGIEVVLVDHNPDHFATKLVGTFICYDLRDHGQDEVHARNIIQLIVEKDITVNGCVTFWEDCGPLAALISELLGLGGPGLRGALTAKKKSSTQNAVIMQTGDTPHFPRISLYSSKSFHINSRSDIEEAASKMEFPCVMKLEYGSSAVGVTLVQDTMQCHREWTIIQDELLDENSHSGIGLGHGNTMLLMDYLSGTEHDVDVIMYKRKLLGAFASDNGPTRLPKFTETSAAMPSFLPDDKRHQLIIAAYQCCVEVGLVTGVFNVELKMTPTGPKVIEINARMSGYFYRDWIKALYSIDLLFYAFMLACDVKPIVPNVTPAGQLIGIWAVPSAHRKALSDPINMKLMHLLEENGVIHINRLDDHLPPPLEDRYEEPFMNVAVMDKDPEIAKMKIIGVCSLLGLNTKEYQVEEFLKDFK